MDTAPPETPERGREGRRVTFLLGPAGSGKTWRCLSDIRAALRTSPEGAPLLLVVPKQATFQLERQLLAEDDLAGYTRLHILSFERLAEFIFDQRGQPPPGLLSEEGRIMVLRALLEQRRRELILFHASARLPGFARQLSALLREFQRHRWAAEHLDRLRQAVGHDTPLGRKLQDVALLLRAYSEWLRDHQLQDADALLDLAADALSAAPGSASPASVPSPPASLACAGLWLDGFAQMTPQERRLLLAILPGCRRATLAFCLDQAPAADCPWHSCWALLARTFTECHAAVTRLWGPAAVTVEVLPRSAAGSRFACQPALRHLEAAWAHPRPPTPPPHAGGGAPAGGAAPDPAAWNGIRLVACPNPEGEAIWVARDILRRVRGGGRFRDMAVLVRQLEPYHDVLRRVFTRYEIPFFIDRREVVAHHPLAELTRSALRTVAFHWTSADWFGALKTGLVPATMAEVDELENEALARGWEGAVWLQPLPESHGGGVLGALEAVRRRVLPPFLRLQAALGAAPFVVAGSGLAEALQTLWNDLNVETTLGRWGGALPDTPGGPDRSPFAVIHETVWDQMQGWLDNLARAFPAHAPALALRDWLPILDAGLNGLSVGIIPPALDQVLIGAVDRSRNPHLQHAFVLGVNQGVFPAPPATPGLLTEADRQQLERHGHELGPNPRLQAGLERYYGYIACTRSRQTLTVTWAQRDGQGKGLHPSVFVSHLQRLVPGLTPENGSVAGDWGAAEHACELVAPLWRLETRLPAAFGTAGRTLAEVPALRAALDHLRALRVAEAPERLAASLAARLYGPILATSVSRLEQFAACPFRFFVRSGLGAEERVRFELDIREQGRFQHEVLELFHHQLAREGRAWRDLTPADAAARIGRIADDLTPRFGGGVMLATEQNRFLAATYKAALQRFIGVMVAWMAQYQFDPAAVELGFGLPSSPLPAWELDLGGGHRLAFRGRIDRVDLWRDPSSRAARCVVIDYKSGQRKLDRVLLAHGIQQQLPAYLNVLRRLPQAAALFHARTLDPAGVFFVNLRGTCPAGPHRREVLDRKAETQRLAYRHQGLFDLAARTLLDNRPDAHSGDQFPYRLRQDGQPCRNSFAALPTTKFHALLDHAETLLRDMGQRIYAGDVSIAPYQKGTDKACDHCEFASICRIDPWTHPYRVLKEDAPEGSDDP
ncbi:MAG: PD-(D/E)XK nuclease family protein [Verrucomicrobia bacterium]|nr:PD-(D/E)XK nuclease family protein [Verrucomicrobiota bacterium]